MDMREAFLAWFDSENETTEFALEDAWCAACEWQKDYIMGEICDALQSDLENGVKWLNEKASREFNQNYPALNKFIDELNR